MSVTPLVDTVDPLVCTGFLIGSLVFAGVFQTIWLRLPVSTRFSQPLDGGLTLRGRRLFGENKTLRGFIVMVPMSGLSSLALASALTGAGAISSGLAGLWPLSPGNFGLLGLFAGLGFMLGELPNSFLKRQLDIPPGGTPESTAGKIVCFVLDRIDSILGMLVLVSLVVPTPTGVWVGLLFLGPGIHWLFSVLLWWLGVKRRPA